MPPRSSVLFLFALGSGQHWAVTLFLYHMNCEHILTLWKQDLAQLLTSPDSNILHPPPIGGAHHSSRTSSGHDSSALGPKAARHRASQLVSAQACPWKQNGQPSAGSWALPNFFPWICRHHGNALWKSWKMITSWVWGCV